MMDKTMEMLSQFEARSLVEQKLKRLPVQEYCSPDWLTNHETIEKLNIQAHKNAMAGADDFIKDVLIETDQKLKDLIYNLIVAETWKAKVLPLVKEDLAKLPSFKAYLAIHHEATICNLLEVLLFFGQVYDAAEDAMLELIDYCYRKMLGLQDGSIKYVRKAASELKELSSLEESEVQKQNIEFNIALMCVGMVAQICMNLEHLSVPVVHQLLENNDVILILVDLMNNKPWVYEDEKGERFKFEDQKWSPIQKNEYHKVLKLEGQIWLGILTVLYSQNTQKRYEITEFRKQVLLKLRKFLNEVVTDQLPVLRNLQRTLEELSITQCPSTPSVNSFIVQQMPEFREAIAKGKNWREIARYQSEHYFKDTPSQRQAEAARMLGIYNSDQLDEFLDDPKCGNCGDPAEQRCSRCKSEWYCGRKCQVAAWKKHKTICDLLAEGQKASEKKIEETREEKREEKQSKTLIQELD